MPFANNLIAANKAHTARKKYEQNMARISRFKFSPQEVISRLRKHIVGQGEALSVIENMLYTVKADFGEKNRPLCVLFLCGPTGVGKTETVRLLAKHLRGDTNRFCRIDMNTLSQEHYAAAITGSPPGYVGSKDGNTVFEEEHIKGSFSEPGIVLFDEIEKASEPVIHALMNVFDNGKLRLTSGIDEIDFSNTLVFMTSNLGARALAQRGLFARWSHHFADKTKKRVERDLNRFFKPEFINRFDAVVTYQPLANYRLGDLLDLEINKLNERLKARAAQVRLDDQAKKLLCLEYDDRYGARDLARNLRRALEPLLARALTEYQQATCFRVTVEQNKGAESLKVEVEEVASIAG